MPHPLSDPATWVASYGDELYRYALWRLRDPSRAEDLVQETFLAALSARERFQGRSSEKAWLFGILRHKVLDQLAPARAEDPVDEIERTADAAAFDEQGRWKTAITPWSNPDTALEHNAFWQVFYECFAQLPSRWADLFLFKEMHGLSGEELRQALGISSRNHVWVMLSRARQSLRHCLASRWFTASEEEGP